jgi:hypothetical protein
MARGESEAIALALQESALMGGHRRQTRNQRLQAAGDSFYHRSSDLVAKLRERSDRA